MATCDVATGITVVFGTSGFSLDLMDVNPFDASRESIDCTHQGSSVAREFVPSDLVDFGELTITGSHDPSVRPPIDQATETVTITVPILTPGNTTNATISGQAFMTGYSVTGALETKIEFEATIKWAGDITVSAEAA